MPIIYDNNNIIIHTLNDYHDKERVPLKIYLNPQKFLELAEDFRGLDNVNQSLERRSEN